MYMIYVIGNNIRCGNNVSLILEIYIKNIIKVLYDITHIVNTNLTVNFTTVYFFLFKDTLNMISQKLFKIT